MSTRAFGPGWRVLGAAGALLLAVTEGATAQAPGNTPTFGVGLELVNVTVTVRDARGRLVSDLGPEDFTVLDEGQPQKVVIFGRAHSSAADSDGDGVPDAEGGEGAAADRLLALDVGLLLDTSESMLPELKLAQEAATRFLESIPRARELFTVFFDEEIRLSRYDSENQQGLYERIHEAKGGGNTALYDALAAYLSRIEGGRGRKVVVLFSDGEDTRSSLSITDALTLIRSSGVSIYPIAFGEGSSSPARFKSRSFLRRIAEMSGGQVFSPGASKELADVFQKILEELSAQYVLGFAPPAAAPPDKLRKLKVRVRKKGLEVRHREGYYPPMPIEPVS